MIIYTNKETTGIDRLFNEIVGVKGVSERGVACYVLILSKI